MLNLINRNSSLPQLLIKLLLRSWHNLLQIHCATNIQTQLPYWKIFPDSRVSICSAGPQHLDKLRVSPDELIPYFNRVMTVGGFQLICYGWLPVQFQMVLTQYLYICNKVDHIYFKSTLYFSRKGCMDTNIIPKSFPFPMNTTDKSPVQNPWKINKIPHYDLHHQDLTTCHCQQQLKTYPSWSNLFGIDLPVVPCLTVV